MELCGVHHTATKQVIGLYANESAELLFHFADLFIHDNYAWRKRVSIETHLLGGGEEAAAPPWWSRDEAIDFNQNFDDDVIGFSRDSSWGRGGKQWLCPLAAHALAKGPSHITNPCFGADACQHLQTEWNV